MLKRLLFVLTAVVLCAPMARAVLVSGHVTDSLGRPLPGSRVQLIRLTDGARNAADTIAGIDGEFELRTDLAGRFLLLTSPSMNAPQYAPQVGEPFYGGRLDALTMEIALSATTITPESSSLATGMPTPLRQLAERPAQVAADQLLTSGGVVQALRFAAGQQVVQSGQVGTPAMLLVRGAPVEHVEVNGVSAEGLGGGFDFGRVTSSGLSAVASWAAIETLHGALPMRDAEAGAVAFRTPAAEAMHPVAVVSVDGGNLSTTRDEAVLTVVHTRSDALLSYARLNTDNDEPSGRVHLVTTAANLGYYIAGNTGLRLTLRDDVSAAPLPSPFAFYQVAPATKLAEQSLIGGLQVETVIGGTWRNELRYGLVRERAQAYNFQTPATGLPVVIVGANGYAASGVATFVPAPTREDAATSRDEFSYLAEGSARRWLRVVGTARYDDERGAHLSAPPVVREERRHFGAGLSFQGEIRQRLFYEAAGTLDHSALLGWLGAPRLGFTFVPVRQGTKKFRGTSLHGTAASGFREPTVLEAALLPDLAAPRSRTFDVGLDQEVLPRRVSLRATYFHGQFSHQVETFATAPLVLSATQAYRVQGLEVAARYRPAPRVLFEGGYTYLASLVERSAAPTAFSPALPGIAIGGTTPLAGARMFHRPPNSGFITAAYTGSAVTLSLKAALAGQSDDSTGLAGNPALLLPNRNLAPGYASIDAALTWNVTRSSMAYAEVTNLTDDRHIAPFGYLSTPLGVRVGVRVRLGRE
jgi:vitamin B12 transporter